MQDRPDTARLLAMAQQLWESGKLWPDVSLGLTETANPGNHSIPNRAIRQLLLWTVWM